MAAAALQSQTSPGAQAQPQSTACTASKCAKCLQSGQPRHRKRCATVSNRNSRLMIIGPDASLPQRGCKCACPRYIDLAAGSSSAAVATKSSATTPAPFSPIPVAAHSAPPLVKKHPPSLLDGTWIKAHVTAWVRALNPSHLAKQSQWQVCSFVSKSEYIQTTFPFTVFLRVHQRIRISECP